jgi:hypothetical protein
MGMGRGGERMMDATDEEMRFIEETTVAGYMLDPLYVTKLLARLRRVEGELAQYQDRLRAKQGYPEI